MSDNNQPQRQFQAPLSTSSLAEQPPPALHYPQAPSSTVFEEVKASIDRQQPSYQIPTDQSNEISIGNKTAEDLVGDILASDPADEEDLLDKLISQQRFIAITDNAAQMAALESMRGEVDGQHLNAQLKLRNEIEGSQDGASSHALGVAANDMMTAMNEEKKKHANEVLSPSRILSGSSLTEGNDVLDAGGCSENPFEVVENEQQQEDMEKQLEEINIIDAAAKNTSISQQKDAQTEGQDDVEEQEEELDATKKLLKLNKQRSNSMDISKPQQTPEKKVKKRLTLPKISIFQKSSNSQASNQPNQTSQQPQIVEKPSEIESSNATTPEKKEQQPASEVTNKTKKGGIMSKLFATKKKDNKKSSPSAKEESKASAAPAAAKTAPPVEAAAKQTSKAPGFQSRLMNLFTKKSKSKEQPQQAKQDEQQSPPTEVAPSEEQKEVVVLEQVVEQPASSLDQGFTSSIGDQYEIDIAQHDEDEPATDCEYDSEATDDEIYSAHEGVDFRPISDTNELRFDGNLGNQAVSPSVPHGRQSFPTSESGDSRHANDGDSTPSLGSFDEQHSDNGDYSQRQRSYSAIHDSDELEFQFSAGVALPPQQPVMRNQSPFERSPQYEPEFKSYEQPYRHSAGFNVGFEALSSGGARTTAAGSLPFVNAGAGGSDRLPFAVSMGSDEQQNMLYMNNNARQSAFVPDSSMAMGHHESVESSKRSPRSFSGCHQSGRSLDGMHSSQGPNFMMAAGGRFSDTVPQHVPQMRISEPFTPSTHAAPMTNNLFTHHKPSQSLGSIQYNIAQHQHHQPQFVIPQPHQHHQADNARYSDTNLGNDQLQTLNLAYTLIYNRPSAPYRNQQQQQYQQNQPSFSHISGSGNQLARYNNSAVSQQHSAGGSVRGPSSASCSSQHNTASRGGTAPNMSAPAKNTSKPPINKRSSNFSNTATLSQSSAPASKPPTKKRGRGGRGRKQLRSSSEKQPSMLSSANGDDDSKGGFEHNKKDSVLPDHASNSNSMQGKNGSSQKEQYGAPLRCVCCSRGLQSCLLELQINQFDDLPSDEKVRALILIDQQLQHFMPMDNKMQKGGGATTGHQANQQSNNNARAGIEGRLKDDIWHECCPCCEQVRKTLMCEMFGHVSELCRDQLCSKFIQVQLSRCQSTEAAVIDAFYEEICRDEEKLFKIEMNLTPESEADQDALAGQPSLMKNVFGNYVIQLIFEKGSSERIEQFYSIMLRQIERLSFDQFGCRIIQKALVWLSLEKKKEIISKFDQKLLVEMMFSEEGNYIVQCIILNLPINEIQFIIPLVQNQVLLLCKDKRGCRVIQRMLEKFPRADIDAPVIQKIIAAANDLTPQQYGNYVITHILQNGLENEKIQIIDAIIENIVKFSLYQLGSNVVENCLKGAPESHRDLILEKIIDIPIAQVYSNHHDVHQVSLANLLENQFGNYVIQHAFNLSSPQRKMILYNKIEQCANMGFVDRSNTYAKHVYSLIHSHLNSNTMPANSSSAKPTSGPAANRDSNALSSSSIFANNAAGEETKSIGKQANKHSTTAGRSSAATSQGAASEAAATMANTSAKEFTKKKSGNAQSQSGNGTPAKPKQKKSAKTSSVDVARNENEKEEVEDREGSDAEAEDGEDENAGSGSAQTTKKRRRRKRRRGNAKKRNQMLCQEDILEELSDSSREEYLQQMPSPLLQTRSNSMSVFVSDSYANNHGQQAKDKLMTKPEQTGEQESIFVDHK